MAAALGSDITNEAWSQEEKDHSWWAKTRRILEASFLPLVWIVEVVLAWSCCSGNWLYSFISSLAWKSMWSVLQFTSKDWMDGSVDGRNILAAYCSSSEGYLPLRSDHQICSLWRFGVQKDPADPTEKQFVWMGVGWEGHFGWMGPHWTVLKLHVQVWPF